LNLDDLTKASLAELDNHLRALVRSPGFRVSEITDLLLKKAVLTRASDLHVDPRRDGVRVRYRIDGVFQEAAQLPVELHDQLVSRIKVLADLISHRKEIVQEGRISLEVEPGKQQDLRVSIVPTVAGEKVVIRMFSSARATFELPRLGYSDAMTRRIETILFDLKGMLILTGPSGSGKTTMLYALLREISQKMDAYASIVTIEDPVEYEFGSFGQMQVNRQAGLDFAAGLKAVLRQDPEVIMVGEIRDVETAEVALRAGLTGHLVLSTIHSGSACVTVTRLVNMGIEPFIVASAVSAVIAQRLVRSVCEGCKEEVEPEKSRLDWLTKSRHAEKAATSKFYRGRGCQQCQFTGFAGRIPIAELLEIDEDLRGMILEKAQTSQLRKHMGTHGWKSLLDDGIEKVLAGKTTLEEVFRLVSLRDAT
jgi:type II secretory ATPase GspE/PulE/Tfp pilus assembly ATPase PilB-like protein